jgi:hypothetical protein
MGDQSSSLREILLISSGGGVGAINDPLGIGRVRIFRVAMYLALELAVVAAARICGRRQ